MTLHTLTGLTEVIKLITIPLIALAMVSAGCAKHEIPKTPEVSSLSVQDTVTMAVKDKQLTIELVNTDESRAMGLSNRASLPENSGMLFDMTGGANKKPGFWMKDMLIPLDIIWIKDNAIIAINKNVPPPKSPAEQLTIYSPPSEIDYVLEVNAGWNDRNSIRIGDPIKLPLSSVKKQSSIESTDF